MISGEGRERVFCERVKSERIRELEFLWFLGPALKTTSSPVARVAHGKVDKTDVIIILYLAELTERKYILMAVNMNK